MPQWLLIALMASQALAVVQQVVQWIEEASTGQPGGFKKDSALAMIKVILQGTAGWSKLDQASIDALMMIVGGLIDTMVAIFNTTGRFIKAPAPQA